MAIFTISSSAYANQPPSAVGDITKSIGKGASHVFTLADFTTNTIPNYSDPEGDALSKIRIETMADFNGQLQLFGVLIPVTTEVNSSDIVAGDLIWVDDGLNNLSHTSTFTFSASDVGSLIFSTPKGTVTINVDGALNESPTSVGDRTESIGYGDTLVFTRDMFTTLTTPAFSDPENDPAGKLKITSLPSVGVIKLNSVAVTLNQIVDFSNIDLGQLTYTGDLSTLTSSESNFNFEIADTVSGIFVG